MKKGDYFWLGLLTLLFALFWIPKVNVQTYLSTGDMGRDLYAFQSTLEGRWPCRYYWWQYGPLMPLYYAFWFLVGGVNIVSVRVGLGVIYFLVSVFAYRTLRLFASPAVSFLSSLAFLSLNMTWTFNHVGAFPFLILSIFCLWKFFLTRQTRWCYFGLVCLVLIAAIKINTGLTSFLAFYISLLLYLRFSRWKHFVFLPLCFGTFVLLSYVPLYAGLPLDWIDQCLTISPKYRVWAYSPWTNFKHLILRFLVWERSRLLWVGAFLILSILAIWGLERKEMSESEKKVYPFVFGSLVLFGLANSVDYFAMEGMIYRFDFWFFPIFVLWMGLSAERASFLFGQKVRIFLGCLIFLSLLWFPFRDFQAALALKVPERFLDFPRGQVYMGGPLSSVQALRQGTRFIIENTKPTQEILAIPYDPIYCFLSGRRHALRELMFVEAIQIRRKQEEKMIQELETKQVPFVLISNRYRSSEPSIGHFGKTHCQRLNQYLLDRYKEVQTYGRWEVDSGQHAVKIFQRI